MQMVRDLRELHASQWEVAQNDARFRFLLAGRGWGKDYLAQSEILKACTQPGAGPGFLAVYIGPSYQQVRAIAWEDFKRSIPAKYIRGKPHETRLEITLRWGPVIRFMGSDRIDSVRGQNINFLVITEHAFCKPGLWKAVRPGLRRKENRALIITTPDGPNHAWELWNKTQKNPSWRHWQLPTWANPDYDRDAVEEARESFTPAEFAQEYEAKFEALTGAIYADFSLDANVLKGAAQRNLDMGLDVYVGQDFNAGEISAVIGQQQGADLVQVDELVTRTHIWDHVQALQKYFEDRRVDWRRRVKVCIDSSGEYLATSKVKSDAVVLRQAGFQTVRPPQNPAVIDRIHAVQRQIKNGKGERHLLVNERCRELIRCLLNQVFNEWHKPDKAKGLDHLPDALGYEVWALHPILPRRAQPEAY